MKNYIERLEKIEEHLEEHPADYQAVIAKLKVTSDIYERQIYLRKVARLKQVAEAKERLKEEDDAKKRNERDGLR